MAIELKLSARKIRITNQNPRPEKHGQEELDAAFDLSASMEITTDEMSQVCYGIYKPVEFSQFFFNNEGKLKSELISGLSITSKFEDCHISLQHDPLGQPVEFKDVKLCKFKPTPQQTGLFKVSFQIQINPTKEQLHYLVDGLTSTEWQFQSFGAIQGDMLDDVESNEEKDEAA